MSITELCRRLLSSLARLVQSVCRDVTGFLPHVFAGGYLAAIFSHGHRWILRPRFNVATLLLVGVVVWLVLGNKAVSVSFHGRIPVSIVVFSPFGVYATTLPTATQLEATNAQIVSLEATLARLMQAEERRDLDDVAKADFALYSTGAKTVPSLTSQTCRAALPRSDLWPAGPAMALHHETHAGYCWPFTGQQGHIGIELSHRIFIESVTVEHLPEALTLDISSAPRRMSVWGLVEGAENIHRTITWQERGKVLGQRKHFALELGDHPDDVQRLLRASRWAPLASFQYDVSLPKAVQSFAVDNDVHGLGVDFKTVLVLINDNWGNEEFTCLYRVRVHGRPVK